MATKLNFPKLSQWPSLPVLPCRRRRLGGCGGGGGGGGAKACASRGTNGRDNGGRLVDENMIVLRMRIRGVKMLENGHDGRDQPPSEWMEWEKQYFVHYNEDVLEGIGLLQNYLMNIRPSLALGLVALFILSVPISSALVIFHVVEITKQIFFRFLLS